MGKTCIICGGRAGSGEHVFPAVLGGRRINNGIYCHTHNQGFSPLASIIGWQLKAMNALLAVRPDHKKNAEPFKYTSPSGEELVIFNGSVARSQPAATGADAPMHIQLKLGGNDGLKAVAYIGLTFFAAYFRDQARKPGLQALKDFLLGTGQNQFVWWELKKPLPGVPATPFPFGHTIILVTSATTGTATAYASFFGALNFGMKFGAIDGLADRTVVIFIDPQADGPPQDLQKHEHNAVLVEVQKPEPLYAHLKKVIADGVGQRALQSFLNRVQEWKCTNELAPVLAEINAARPLAAGPRLQEITRIIDGQLSRIYQIMRYIADNFAATRTGPVAGRIITVFNAMVKIEDVPKQAFGPHGQHVFLESRTAIISELETRLSRSDVDMDFLYRLLSGNIGAGIIGKIMFERADAVLFGGA